MKTISPLRYPGGKTIIRKQILEIINANQPINQFIELFAGGAGLGLWLLENEIVDPERNSVTDQLWVVCESLPCSPLGHSLWEIAGFGRAEIAGHWPVSVVEVYQLKKWESEGSAAD